MARGPGIRTEAVLGKPDFTQGVVLAAATPQAIDTPAGMGFANFSFNTDIWVNYGSTVVNIPTSTTTAGTTTGEFNPTMRNITSTAQTTGISLVSATTGSGSISWFKPA